jgi:DNA-binding CsgD family transcriptional regulator
VHGALAEETDPVADPDRRAWHRAQGSAEPDEGIAAELESSAGRAQARGGMAAAAAFLERAALLTSDPRHRARRLLASAKAKREAGALDAASELLAAAVAGPLDGLGAADAERLRGQIASDQRRMKDSVPLFLSAARLFAPVSSDLAREAYLEALFEAAMWVGDRGARREAAQAAREAPPAAPGARRPVDALLDALALRFTDGYTAAAPTVTRALELDLALDVRSEEARRWLWSTAGNAGQILAMELWDFTSWVRAFLSDDDTAERWYRESIERLGQTEIRAQLARSHLLYGEWLRRQNRRAEAREQLRTAYQMLTAMGIEGFAESARQELIATGEAVRLRTVSTDTTLTAQEALIARLARDGRTNPEIGAQLFLSARTVQYHLRKVFTKLGIESRRELHAALAQSQSQSQSQGED